MKTFKQLVDYAMKYHNKAERAYAVKSMLIQHLSL